MLEMRSARESDPALVAQAKALLEMPGPAPEEARIPLRVVRQQTRELKNAALDLYSRWSAQHGTGRNPARDLLVELSKAQGRREVAFFKETGWVQTEDDF